ncbi:MAG: hypothetical protein ACE5DX_03480 [Candidatus Dojkabacteria bacterium]
MANKSIGFDPAPPGKYPIKTILTDSDLDGIVSGAILRTVYPHAEIVNADATGMQEGKWDHLINESTLIVDLKYKTGVGLYFDHHKSNKPDTEDFPGRWQEVDSAARVVYEYFKSDFDLAKFDEIVTEVDKLDMGKLTLDEFLNPSGVIKLGLTINNSDLAFNYLLIELLATQPLQSVLDHHLVNERIEKTLGAISQVYKYIKGKVELINNVAYIDLSEYESPFRVSSFAFIAKFPKIDAAVVFKKSGNPEGYKVRMYRNNFNKRAHGYHLLKVAKKLNPSLSGGHKNACGFTPKAGKSKKDTTEQISRELQAQRDK